MTLSCIHAQKNDLPSVKIPAGEYTLAELLYRVRDSTGLMTFVAVSGSDGHRKVFIQGGDMPIFNLLEQFFPDRVLDCKKMGNCIFVKCTNGVVKRQAIPSPASTPDTTIRMLENAVVTEYVIGGPKRFNEGSHFISRSEFQAHPITTIGQELAGQISGLVTRPTSGVHGAAVELIVRGPSSIFNGRDPLILIDGVPFAPNNQSVSHIPGGNAAGSLSPLSFIASADIERIEVVKDASATAAYGSMGANGVILITTRQARHGRIMWDVQVSRGISAPTVRPQLQNTYQYIKMRREALTTDGVVASSYNAPDLVSWDTTAYTNWSRYLLRDGAPAINFQSSLSGGTDTLNYFFGFNHTHQTDVFLTRPAHDLSTLTGNLNLQSRDRRLGVKLYEWMGWDQNNQFISDPTRLQYLAPNAPDFPYAKLLQHYVAQSRNVVTGVNVRYRINNHLQASCDVGYSGTQVGENSYSPGHASALSTYKAWMMQPQLTYHKVFQDGVLNLSTGMNWQSRGTDIYGRAAARAEPAQSQSYKNYAFFTRLYLQWKGGYTVDLSGRSDGTTRFGGGPLYGNFGSAAVGWTFTSLPAIRRNLPFLDRGRIRAALALTGNDQIGEGYRHVYLRGNMPYENVRKQEITLDLEILQHRLMFSATWYKNHSLNQLIPEKLGRTGIASFASLPVKVQNTGVELNLSSSAVKDMVFEWTSSLNISLPANRLVEFPGLQDTRLQDTLIIGKSLTTRKLVRLKDVDMNTGIYRFGSSASPMNADLGPVLYGGWRNTLTWRGWQLSLLLEARIQQGIGYMASLYELNHPGVFLQGYYSNQTTDMLHRWRKPGDVAYYQRVSSGLNAEVSEVIPDYLHSSGILTDASFVRVRSIVVSYTLPQGPRQRTLFSGMRLQLSSDNPFTFTRYRYADPEIQDVRVLPTAKTFLAGIYMQF